MTREALLERYGRFYGDEHFAIAFTAGVEGESAKRVVAKGWDRARPLASGDFAAGLISNRGRNANVAIVLRPSNLIVIECDSEADLERIDALDLPVTLTARSSQPFKRHFYFRPAETMLALPYVAFRFESGKLTADSGRYFVAPPSLHPSGVMYDFLPELGPFDVDIVELPEERYRWLVEHAERETHEQRERIAQDPDAKIKAGQRRDSIFRYACMLRRWGRPYEAILADCLAFNDERCEPPVERALVEVQVQGAMKMRGDQEIARAQHVAGNGHVVETAPPLDTTTSTLPTAPVIFEPLRDFLVRDLPQAESLVGVVRDGTNLLPRHGWVMPWGREGSGKTSILVDLLFHAAAGVDWLTYAIERPLRVVAIINEGIPGGFQDKLRQKIERWQGDDALVRDNLAIYASPWGEFTFRSERMFEHARSYALDFGADYVALDPLHTLGTTGGGAPTETEEFKHLLRAFGMWSDLGVLTSHHSNKAGMVSGDWGRHPDTVIRIEKDGKRPATKFTLEKARPADPAELGVPVLFEWIIETFGYARRSLDLHVETSDDELLDRVKTKLAEADGPWTMREIQRNVTGTYERLSAVVKQALNTGELANVSTNRSAFAIVLPDRFDPPTKHDEPRLFDDAQNGIVEPEKRFVEGDEADRSTGGQTAGAEVLRSSRPPFRGEGHDEAPKRSENEAVDNPFIEGDA